MQPKNKRTKERRVPPQLIGIIQDAARESIDMFTLEYSRDLVMASFSAPGRATEIDFEFEAGEEMFTFLRACAPNPRAQQWLIRFTFDSVTYELMVQRTGKGPDCPLQVRWSALGDQAASNL